MRNLFRGDIINNSTWQNNLDMADKTLDINELKVKKFIERNRPPVHMRSKLDIGYSYDGRTIELYDIRPDWNDPSVFRNYSYAKIKYVRTQQTWKLYWFRASGKWESYEPLPESTYLEKLLECIDEDAYGCFKG